MNGAGKTELAGTACDVPAMGDVFILSAEKGELTIQESERIKDKDKIFVAQVDDIATCEQVRQWLLAHCKFRDDNNGAGDEEKLKMLEERIGMDNPGPAKRFNTVIIDTISEVQAFAMYQTLGISTTLALDATLPDQEWSHHNKILQRIQMFARAIRDLPMHVICLAQVQYVQDETKRRIFMPQLTGQMAKKVCGFFDMVGYLDVVRGDKGEIARRLWIQPVGPFEAKNRIGSYKEPFMDDATMPKIFSAIGISQQRTAQNGAKGNTPVTPAA